MQEDKFLIRCFSRIQIHKEN